MARTTDLRIICRNLRYYKSLVHLVYLTRQLHSTLDGNHLVRSPVRALSSDPINVHCTCFDDDVIELLSVPLLSLFFHLMGKRNRVHVLPVSLDPLLV